MTNSVKVAGIIRQLKQSAFLHNLYTTIACLARQQTSHLKYNL